MSGEALDAILSSGVGVLFVIIARLVDKFLPDTKHPLPDLPDLSTGKHAKK